MKVAVTGGSGKIGAYVISELISHDFHVLSVDVEVPSKQVRFIRADLTDLGQTAAALAGPMSRTSRLFGGSACQEKGKQ